MTEPEFRDPTNEPMPTTETETVTDAKREAADAEATEADNREADDSPGRF